MLRRFCCNVLDFRPRVKRFGWIRIVGPIKSRWEIGGETEDNPSFFFFDRKIFVGGVAWETTEGIATVLLYFALSFLYSVVPRHV